jgi:hypothetical protein
MISMVRVDIRRELIVVVIATSAIGVQGSATTIVGVRTPDFVLIAVDSKPIYRGTPGATAVCKIEPLPGGFLAIASLDHDNARGFYVKDLARVAFESGGSFSELVARTEQVLRSAAAAELRRLRAEHSDTYRYTIKNDGNVIDLFFAANEGNTPRMSARRFHFDEPSGSVEVGKAIDCPGKDCPTGTYLMKIGETFAIDKFLSEHAKQELQPELLVRTLLELQIKESPDKVGPPIEILRIDATGVRWVTNDLGCPSTAK